MARIMLQVTVEDLDNDDLDNTENDIRRFLKNYQGNGKVSDVSETDRDMDETEE